MEGVSINTAIWKLNYYSEVNELTHWNKDIPFRDTPLPNFTWFYTNIGGFVLNFRFQNVVCCL